MAEREVWVVEADGSNMPRQARTWRHGLTVHRGEHGPVRYVPESASRELTEPLERWAVRVLDAWRASAIAPRKRGWEFEADGTLYICEWEPFARMGQRRDAFIGSPDAARIAAARALCAEHPGVYPKEPGT